MSASYFTTPDGEWFQPDEMARGPWDADACHAGPPTGLLARASELAVPAQTLVRITVDLIRPVPFAGFRIETEVVRQGRTVSTTRMRMLDGDGREVLTAAGMHVADGPPRDEPFPTVEVAPPNFDDAVDGPFMIDRTTHGLTWFGDSMEVRYPPGVDKSAGPTAIWARTKALLPDEEPSPFQRICPLADCGNAIGRNAELDAGFAFMNTDLTVVLHRRPEGDWFAMDALSHWQPAGHGISDATLFDRRGAVGRALQTLVVR